MATYTDKELIKIEKRISKIYKQSQAEIEVKWNTYMIKAEKRIEKAKKVYEAAYLAPNLDQVKIKELKEQYQKAIYNATLGDKHYKTMVDQVTSKLANVNQEALDYVNDKMPPIYCHAYNEFENQHIAGYSFETVNENAVRNLIKNGDKTLLPKKTVNIPKDKIWNTKNINSQVLQGIIQGESIPKIAKRLQTVTDMNRNASVRNARTMATGAESKGHIDSFKRASKDGVILKKVWVSTHDGRTRDWHADLNGKEVDVDEPFDSEYGEISYPGDPTAHPANVYNCRCAVRAKVIGFKWNKGDAEAENEKIVAKSKTGASLKSTKIKRDYNTDFAKYYGGQYYDEMSDLVDACGNEDLKAVWQQYQSKIGAKDVNYKGRAHASIGNIHVNKNDAKGSSWSAPYEVTYHESGHAIDFLAKDLADTNGLKLMYSSAYKDGLFPSTIRDEVANLVNAKDVELKTLFNAHKNDYAWLHDHGFISEYSWRSYQTNGQLFGGTPKYSKSFAYDAITKEIKAIPGGGIAISDLSDMLEGATDGKIRCGYGHGRSYWKKLLGVDEKLATEAFAEMTSASITNSQSLDVIKKYLPKSYSVYSDMIKELASKGG